MESYLRAEVSGSAVRHNAALLRGLLGPGTKLCAVVKADCYGHGLHALLGVMAGLADCLGVTSPEEAVELRRLGYERPILMFFSACAHADGKEKRDALAELIARHVTLTVVAAEELAAVADVAAQVGADAEVQAVLLDGARREDDEPRLHEPVPDLGPGHVRPLMLQSDH